MSREDLVNAVLALGLPPQSRILVAVSGGPDSVALLRAFLAARMLHPGWDVAVGHVEHGLRRAGEEDMAFVRDLAGRFEVPFFVRLGDTPALARREKLSEETAARTLRHRSLEQMLRQWGGDVIALGHTLDDQAETVLMRILRGTGVAGLGGMAEHSGVLVRPLLTVTRVEILAALSAWQQEYREDESNRDERYTRNRVRHTILPVLRDLSPHVSRHLARLAHTARIETSFIEAQVAAAWPYVVTSAGPGQVQGSRPPLTALDPAIRLALLRRFIREALDVETDVDAAHVEAVQGLLAAGLGSHTLPGGARFVATERDFGVERRTSAVERQEAEVLPVPGVVTVAGGRLTARVERYREEEMARLEAVTGPWHALLDAGKIEDVLVVRGRQPGDRIACLPDGHSRRLQDLFVDLHIPAEWRDIWPVVEGGGEILWVPGIATRSAARAGGAGTIVHLLFEPGSEVTHGRISGAVYHLCP